MIQRRFIEADLVQTLPYLKASGYKVGLLLNPLTSSGHRFGAPKLEIKRLANRGRWKH